MILNFYQDANKTTLCSFIENYKKDSEQVLFTYEITGDLIHHLSQVIWFDDLPLTVPADKLYGFLLAVGIDITKLASENGFWVELNSLVKEQIPYASAFRK